MKGIKRDLRLKAIAPMMLGMSSLFIGCGYSQAASDSVNFRVKVEIQQKTCDVNDNNPIHVDFGDMIIKNIDGAMYEKSILYTLDCEDTSNSQGLKLQISGNGANFNNDLLQTSEPNLGLRFKQNNIVFARNAWVNFTYGSPPNLSVVPVAYGQDGLNDGDFTAAATFNVEYQ